MYRKFSLLSICFFCLSYSSFALAGQQNTQSINELQVLIDVSGSMKKNDPRNLRIPAVKLLINLLPKGTRAGVWLFAEQPVELVKTATVDQQWKKNALAQLTKIHSSGLFTDIESAINSAAASWFKKLDEQNSRHLILLTDGVIDVSKDIMQSAESRVRIMEELLPLLLQAGVQVQTIALSAQADGELLDKLAFDTLGWSETVLSAEQLQKVFFKLFKQAIPQDSVPINGNSFAIDASIKEFSLLVFKQQGAAETQLIRPDKSRLGFASKDNQVAWLAEKNYDLVTVQKPAAGLWQIEAEMDPDNQVMIVTDLKFKLDELPRHLALNEALQITAYFTDKQHLISRSDFLSLIDISVQSENKNWRLSAVPQQAGLFSLLVPEGLPIGRHELSIVADGKTFKRQLKQTIEVIESLVTVDKTVDSVRRMVDISLQADNNKIDAEMMAIEVTITQPGKKTESYSVGKKDGRWSLQVPAAEPGESKIVNFSVMAQTLQGEPVSPSVPALIIDDTLFVKQQPDQGKSAAEKEPPEEKQNIVEQELIIDDEQPEKEPANWIKSAIIALIVTVFLLITVYFSYKYFNKKRQQKQQQLLNNLD